MTGPNVGWWGLPPRRLAVPDRSRAADRMPPTGRHALSRGWTAVRGRRRVPRGVPADHADHAYPVRRPRWRRGRPVADVPSDRGSVTVELAVALPVLVLLLLAGLSAVDAVATKMRCVDAAREAARAEARGEPGAPAGQRAAPNGASVQVNGGDDTVSATVTVAVRPFGPALPGFAVAATAVAAREPEDP
jgi:hypothetical protein